MDKLLEKQHLFVLGKSCGLQNIEVNSAANDVDFEPAIAVEITDAGNDTKFFADPKASVL